MKVMKITIIGYFAKNKNVLGGQEAKTRTIAHYLSLICGKSEVSKIDTAGGKSTLFKAPFQCVKALQSSKNVIIMPAHNGLRVYAPLLSFFKRFFKNRKLHYVVIGGWLPEFLKNRKGLSKKLKKFDGIYVETNTMKKTLEKQGFTNIFVMPNCKNLKTLKPEELVYPNGEPYKLCTFSRVMKEKGIETAVKAVKQVNEEFGRTVYTLDVYGQIDSGQTQWFEDLQTTFPDYINYRGIVDYDKSVDVLKSFFALLFPTYYEGEGFAGTILDAFASGVPVIASDWKYNAEIVNDNVGFIYSIGDKQAFLKLLESIAGNPAILLDKKVQCLTEAERYKPENVVRILIERMER